MDSIEISAIQIVLFLFFSSLFDPLIRQKIGEWF